jgi:hypothetical protein
MFNKSKNILNNKISTNVLQNIIAASVCIGMVAIGVEALAQKGGVEIAEKMTSTIVTFLTDKARPAIIGSILAAGGVGAVMSKTWLPIGASGVGIAFYEIIRSAI